MPNRHQNCQNGKNLANFYQNFLTNIILKIVKTQIFCLQHPLCILLLANIHVIAIKFKPLKYYVKIKEIHTVSFIIVTVLVVTVEFRLYLTTQDNGE